MAKDKKAKKGKKDFVWANRINLTGLYSDYPVKCVRGDNEDEPFYVAEKDLDFVVNKIGLDVHFFYDYVVFSSRSKEEVETWILGARSSLTVLHALARNPLPYRTDN